MIHSWILKTRCTQSHLDLRLSSTLLLMAFFSDQETRLHNLLRQPRIFIVLYLCEVLALLLARLPIFFLSLLHTHTPPLHPTPLLHPTFLSIVTISSRFTSSSANSVQTWEVWLEKQPSALFGSAQEPGDERPRGGGHTGSTINRQRAGSKHAAQPNRHSTAEGLFFAMVD